MAKKKEEVLETIEEATGENNTVDVGALYGVKDEKLSKQELDDLVNKFLSK